MWGSATLRTNDYYIARNFSFHHAFFQRPRADPPPRDECPRAFPMEDADDQRTVRAAAGGLSHCPTHHPSSRPEHGRPRRQAVQCIEVSVVGVTLAARAPPRGGAVAAIRRLSQGTTE